MDQVAVFVLAFLIGVITGLRSFTAPAVVAWAAHLNWLKLHDTSLDFMSSTAAVAIFTTGAIGEFIADKLASTPDRTKILGLSARTIFGGLSGACLAVAGGQSLAFGAILGVAGGIAGAFVGYEARTRLVKALKVKDYVIALSEDAVAIAGGLLIVAVLNAFYERAISLH